VRLYPDWHEFVTHGRENMVKRLRVTSIVNSAILDWSEDFSHFRLWESETLVTCSKKGYALDIPQLKKVQDTFREKTVKIIQHIYYRGIILICKKAKYFRRKSDGKGKWTLNGFKITSGYDQSLDSIDYGEAGNEEEQNTIEENIIYSLVNSNCQFEKGFDYFANVTRIEQLQDIRDSPAYKVYSVLADHPLNFDENIYKALPKTERKLLRASVGVEASLFLRKIIERSVIDFKNFFCKTRKLREIEAQLKRRLVGREEYDPHEDKQSKFLMHIPINSDGTAVPPLSNSTSHFQSQP
jgi:dynein heavy chain